MGQYMGEYLGASLEGSPLAVKGEKVPGKKTLAEYINEKLSEPAAEKPKTQMPWYTPLAVGPTAVWQLISRVFKRGEEPKSPSREFTLGAKLWGYPILDDIDRIVKEKGMDYPRESMIRDLRALGYSDEDMKEVGISVAP